MRVLDRRRPLGPFSVAPVGFGAMRLAGPNVFGPPADRRQAIAVLREAIDRGVDHIDTAQFYGPDIVNELIREALHPYPSQLVIVSKVGASRDTRGGIFAADAPEQLRHGIEDNLRTLGVDTLPVVNLRLMRASGPDAFFDDQLAAMIAARDDGLIASIGLSNITLDHLLYALRVTDVACVQNPFHLGNRMSQPVLDECTRRRIAFVPFASLGFGAAGPTLCSMHRKSLPSPHVWAARRPRSHWPGRWTRRRTSSSSPAHHRCFTWREAGRTVATRRGSS